MEKRYNKFVYSKNEEMLFNGVSLGMMLFILYYMSFGIDHVIKESIYFFYVIVSILLQFLTFFRLENSYFFEKTMNIGKKYLFIVPAIICVLGLCELFIQYISMNVLHRMVNIFNSIITVPVIILSLNCYLRNINKKYKIVNAVAQKINLAAIRLYGIIVLLFLCALWGSYERSNFSTQSLFVNLIYEWLSMLVLLVQCTYMVMALLYAAKNKDTIKHLNYKSLFPYRFFLCGGLMIVVWGGVGIFTKTFIIETAYLITTLIYFGLYLFCFYIVRKKIGCNLKREDLVISVVSNLIILLNYFWVEFNAANNIAAGDFITIIVEVISLIGCVGAGVYVIKRTSIEAI